MKDGARQSFRVLTINAGTPIVTLRGPKGSVRTEGMIVAKRHIHMNTKDARKRRLKHGYQVEIAVRSAGTDLVFCDVAIRSDLRFVTEMHIDIDEANAAHLKYGGAGELMPVKGCTAHLTHIHTPQPAWIDPAVSMNQKTKWSPDAHWSTRHGVAG